ncbi:MAG: hypothetical protein CL862_11470 [Cyanobium sp. NAT70]|nr:hypothetical protein [Cyanobium sp. NAT70]
MLDFESNHPSPPITPNLKVGSEQSLTAMRSAIDLEANGKHDQALQKVELLLHREPNNPSLYFLAARILLSKRDLVPAKNTIEHALRLEPEEASHLKLCADIYAALFHITEASETYLRALNLDYSNVTIMNNLGVMYRQLGEIDKSLRILNRALEHDEFYAPALYNLAFTYCEADRLVEAEGALSTCLDIDAEMIEAWLLQDDLIQKLDRSLDERIKQMELAIKKSPNELVARLQLINILEENDLAEKALPHYKEIKDSKPELTRGLALDFEKRSRYCLNRLEHKLAQQFSDMAVRLDPSPDIYQVHLFMSAYLPVLNKENRFRNLRNWNSEICSSGRERKFTHELPSIEPKKLRVGYVSPDLHNHAVTFFLQGLIANHSRDSFEVFAYSQQHKRDEQTEVMRRLFDHWREIQFLEDYPAAKLIKDDGIDILVDCSGHTGANRVGVFAYKPAPIQLTYIGSPSSTGLDEMDYWLTDHVIHPAGTTEPSSERKFRLDRCWMAYTPKETSAEITTNLSDAPFTFGVINHIGKHSADFIKAWVRILDLLPESRLIVKSLEFDDADLRLKVLDLLKTKGLDRERLLLLGKTRTFDEHLATYNLIDLCLDPFPYTGGTSTCDALLMGTPLITLAGEGLRERMSASMLASINRNEWVTASQEEYIELAYEMSTQRTSLEQKQLIRNQFLNSPLTDVKDLTLNVENAYRAMWKEYQLKG